MTDNNKVFALILEPDETIVSLKDDVGIYHSKQLKEVLMQAVDTNKTIRIDMSALNGIDLTILQLLVATKMSAKESHCDFRIDPISDKANEILNLSGMTYELMS